MKEPRVKRLRVMIIKNTLEAYQEFAKSDLFKFAATTLLDRLVSISTFP